MRISYQWLRERVATKLDARALADRLTLAGIEVGAIEPVAPPLDNVVVGEVTEIAPHPSADRLKCCRVRVSRKQVLDIVCGAGNVAVKMRVPVALPGAKLPKGNEIRESDIRGQRSQGMLCSAVELGLDDRAEGLLDLGSDAPLGMPLARVLGLDDVTLEVELTPNRGDCLSISGLAREITALTGAKHHALRLKGIAARSRRRVEVVLEAAQDCPHYAGRVIEDIDPDSRTPLWMKERLRRSGIRSIHPVVDVTNYVMLELGQPMHAFDLARLAGKIRVRHAKAGEQLALLDGKQIELQAGSLLIADDQHPLALAGIMGGQDSGVDAGTNSIFLESAYFRPQAISGRARGLGLQTDSSYRFERGVDPQLQRLALERATALLLDIVGGKPGPVTDKTSARHLPRITPIRLRAARVTRVLGTELPRAAVEAVLKRLAMRLSRHGSDWKVLPPSYRFDIEREEDLIEEIARVHGYANLPSRLPLLTMAPVAVPEGQVGIARLRELLVDRDYQEVITYSFVDPAMNSLIDPAARTAVLANPIAADMAVMRTSLWPGLLNALRYNLNRQQTRVRLFEVGGCFVPAESGYRQDRRIGGALCGPVMAEQWGCASRRVDYFDAKADVEALIRLTGRLDEIRFVPSTHPALHPGQSADIVLEGRTIGMAGSLHPEIMSKLGFEQPVLLFEVDTALFQRANIAKFAEISRFPSIRRDIAIIVDAGLPAAKIIEKIKNVAGKLLVNLELFDEYRGKGIDSGRKSLALGLTFQDSSRTLKEVEVEAETAKVINTLEAEYRAELRR
jgi:phenylalanyl-tRNA synthetase beta chain